MRCDKIVLKVITFLGMLFFLSVLIFASNEIIEKIELVGNTYFTKDAFFHLLKLKAGDPYDEDRIREEFKKLWESGYFNDLYVEAEDGEKGKIVRFRIKERPKISIIKYDDIKSITQSTIEDRLKERGIVFKTNTPLNMKTIWKVEETIKELLAAKGYLDAQVEAEIKPITATTRSVHFKTKHGPKTKIRKIEFVGNEVFKDRKLKKAMELTREHRFWMFFSKKDLYHPAKYEMDIGNVRDLYLNHGYLDVHIGPPIVEIKEEKKRKRSKRATQEDQETKKKRSIRRIELALEKLKKKQEVTISTEKRAKIKKKIEKLRKKQKKKEEKERKKREKAEETRKWVYLTIPVTEGKPYTLGDVRIEGNTLFSEEDLRKKIPLKKGDILNESALKYAVEVITADYGEQGYLYATVNQQKIRKEGYVADVVIQIDEDEQYYVEKIEFEGNNVTNDNVLRREMILSEGSLFNQKKLNISAIRVNQLGYFVLTEEPLIEPIPGEKRVRITIKGEEREKNEIQVGGGYSGLEGAFFAGSYSTKNFLGRGEIFSIFMQVGGRSTLYRLQFIEPWLFSMPYTFGFKIYHQQIDFGRHLSRTGKGGGIVIGRRIGHFAKMEANYNLEQVESEDVYGTLQKTRINSITPTFEYNKVNNPFRPSRGYFIGFRSEVAGGFLGGDVSFVRPRLESTFYPRFYKNTFFAIHGEAGYITPFGETKLSGLVDGVPRYLRYYLGGEYLGPRIYETRSISPVRILDFPWIDPLTGKQMVDEEGNPVFFQNPVFVGGNKYLILQLEYVIPVSEAMDFAFFFDAGNSFDNGQNISLSDLRMSTGIEIRFYIPMFQVPLRLIYGFPINEKPWDEINRFQFSIGTSF